MYLGRADVDDTLRYIGTMPSGSAVIFDYAQPPEVFPWLQRMFYRKTLDRLAEMGEPWISFMQPEPLRKDLISFGFSSIDDLGGEELNSKYLSNRTDGLKARSIGRVVVARV
jgi:O-methyltransferase involved in polyketide biosynthesis